MPIADLFVVSQRPIIVKWYLRTIIAGLTPSLPQIRCRHFRSLKQDVLNTINLDRKLEVMVQILQATNLPSGTEIE